MTRLPTLLWLMIEARRRERVARAGDEDIGAVASSVSFVVSMSNVRKVIFLSLFQFDLYVEVLVVGGDCHRQNEYA